MNMNGNEVRRQDQTGCRTTQEPCNIPAPTRLLNDKIGSINCELSDILGIAKNIDGKLFGFMVSQACENGIEPSCDTDSMIETIQDKLNELGKILDRLNSKI